MRKVIVVAKREYQSAVKTKAFLIGLLMMPLIFGGSIVIQRLLRGSVDTKDRRIAVADYTGRLFEVIESAAQQHNESAIYEGESADRKQVRPRFVVDKVETSAEDAGRLSLNLSNRVRKNEIMAFVIIGPGALDTGGNPSSAITYHSNTPTYDDLRQWLSLTLNERIQQSRLQAANLDPKIVREVTQRVAVGNLGLVKMDESGNITQAQQANVPASILVPFALVFLMFMVVMATATPLMNIILEEKTHRIAEVLLGSISPFQLMLGKLMGIVGVSLTMAAVYLIGGYAAISRAGYAEYFPWNLLGWFLVFLVLSVLMYGSIFIAIGAAVTDMKEAQSLMSPVMILVIFPMIVSQSLLREPNSSLSLAMSLFPPATPMLMIVRQAVPPGIPLWQPILGVTLVVLTSLLCVFAAGRVFRVGILMQGKGANLTEMIRWALRG
jgi:ABC-2 type transport system permease protein